MFRPDDLHAMMVRGDDAHAELVRRSAGEAWVARERAPRNFMSQDRAQSLQRTQATGGGAASSRTSGYGFNSFPTPVDSHAWLLAMADASGARMSVPVSRMLRMKALGRGVH